MNKFAAGAAGMLLMMIAGVFFWMGANGQDVELPDAPPPPKQMEEKELPETPNVKGMKGPAPPTPPKAYQASREEKRFNRYDRNRDEIVTRIEMMSSRTTAFRKLDVDGNNLLTFEEWAAATSKKFVSADANKDSKLTRTEFQTTKPKSSPKPKCKC